MRIYLGHHFYGAGNLGDDFMLAGFLESLGGSRGAHQIIGATPFPLEPLRRRFPEIEWLPYDPGSRNSGLRRSDVWLGLGGSPFQCAHSRWFVDHLNEEAARCREFNKPMYYLGIGSQSEAELQDPDVRRLCAQARAIWTRDALTAQRLQGVAALVEEGADLAHAFFRSHRPPLPRARRIALTPNFDFGEWPGQSAFVAAAESRPVDERIWLAQESRELAGAELMLYSGLSPAERQRWRLIAPDLPGFPLTRIVDQWPMAEYVVTARYHSAVISAWAGAKLVVIETNEKLRAASREFQCATVAPDASATQVSEAFRTASAPTRPHARAELADAACQSFLRAASTGA